MPLEELLNSKTPPKKNDLTDEDITKLFIKYKGLLKKIERDEAFWIATNENIKIAYSKLDELVEERTIKLKTVNEQLQQELNIRKKAENKLKESEKKYRNAHNQANFYKDLFAHDLNNILNNIGRSEELISLFLNNPDNLNDIKKYLNIVKEQVIRGSVLISNVQKLSQLEESEMSIESMEICKLLKEAIQFTRKGFPSRNISVQIDSIGRKLFVQANDLLLDAFDNILNNAIKFNKNPQIEILIKISKFQKKGIKYLRIEFVDNGIGIPDDRKKVIFQRALEK